MASPAVLPVESKSPVFRDLPYEINNEHYVGTRLDILVRAELPAGFPSQVQNSMTWKPSDLAELESQWIVELSQVEADAVEKAIKAFIGMQPLFSENPTDTFLQSQRQDSKSLAKRPSYFPRALQRNSMGSQTDATMDSASASCED
jgi:hypothetical protein